MVRRAGGERRLNRLLQLALRAIYGRYVPEPVKNSLRVQLMLLRRDVEPARANPPTGRLAVVAPHMDDEVFGCGGTIALAADAGARITFVYVTDGSKGYPGARLESPANAEVRRRASRRSGDPGSPPLAAPPAQRYPGRRRRGPRRIVRLSRLENLMPPPRPWVTMPTRPRPHARDGRD
jgi:GlcNAc-PI de-N-acetylase